ncbi:hypothetical protein SRABI96_03371 [Peribacillus sp. Bi96]|uniref:hypothetical protein n=1 Tax=unclassified Peribacillus TaxID=2675266 RepID=UPI001D7A7D5F|nr:hypothetical protein [Peribacillus sp. Bi96]CAH0258939.1 hypothetical protein SRABI96_03371 [Peribacillus sp. Bi96]
MFYKVSKVLGMFALVFLLFLVLPTNSKAESNDEGSTPIYLSDEEKDSLKNLGFSEEEIDSMTEEEYEAFANIDGELTGESTEFFQVTEQQDGQVDIIPVTEEQATQGLFHDKVMRATKTEKTSWISLTLTSSKLSNGNTLLKNSFKWLKSPNVGLKDVLAITHSTSAVKVSGTDKFVYKYTDGSYLINSKCSRLGKEI